MTLELVQSWAGLYYCYKAPPWGKGDFTTLLMSCLVMLLVLTNDMQMERMCVTSLPCRSSVASSRFSMVSFPSAMTSSNFRQRPLSEPGSQNKDYKQPSNNDKYLLLL